MIGTILAVVALFGSPGRDSVYGAVRDAISGARLSGVLVEGDAAEPGTVSREEGTYAIVAGSAGPQRLRFSRAGYDELLLSVNIPPGASLRVDVELDPLPVPLPVLEVAGHGAGPPSAPFTPPDRDSFEIGFRRLAADSLPFDPLVVGDDPLLMSGTGPESGMQSDLPSTLRIRGGSSDQNLVLLEGLPVYGSTHLGGAASLFDPEAVSSVDLHSAVPPAHLGGRLSSAIDVHLRPPPPAAFQFSGAVDPTAVRQTIAGPIAGGAGSILLSGRQSYRGVFAQDGDRWLANDFHDFLARGSLQRGRNDVALYLLASGDRLRFPASGLQTTGNKVDQPPEDLDHQFGWGSLTAGAVWNHSRKPGTTLATRLWRASSDADVLWAASDRPARVESGLEDLGVNSELVAGSGLSQHRLGVALQRTRSRYQIWPIASPAGGAAANPVRLESTPTIISAYGEERRIFAGRWSVSAGLRANSVNATNLLLEPRFSVRYRLADGVTFSAGAARVHQFVQSMRNEESLLDRAFGADLPISIGAGGLPAARSDQLSAALETRLGSTTTVTLDAYVRRFTGLLVPAAGSAAPFSSIMPPFGSGHAHGIALDTRFHRGQLELRANLGVAASERSTELLEFSPGALRSRWLAVGVVRRLGKLASVRLASTMASGGPTSLIGGPVEWQSPGGLAGAGEIAGSPNQILGALNGVRLPTYFRTDLGVVRQWPVSVGRNGVLTTTLAVTNLLNRRNPLGYVAPSDFQPRRALLFSARSLTMQVGWRF
ncbi:MAG: TonB-dependent receptor [Gemmatimonadales bacterium]